MNILDQTNPSDPIVILTGAGISKESGLATFRDPHGIWARHKIEDVATPEAFARNPEAVLDFYNVRRAQMNDSDLYPNAAHQALGALEEFWPGGVLVVTQNIDDLHARGGVPVDARCPFAELAEINKHVRTRRELLRKLGVISRFIEHTA